MTILPEMRSDSVTEPLPDSDRVDCAGADFRDLPLDQLRECRKVLTARESQISYWRRIIQARLDLVRDSAIHGVATLEGLERVLTRQLSGNQRLGMLSVHPRGATPIAGLDRLWKRSMGSDDANSEDLEADLMAAEQELSSLRAELHRQIDAATAELISRYRAEPQLAFTALPQRDPRPTPL